MLRDGKSPSPFDREAFDRAHDEIVELTGRLPQRAVRTLAEEVVARLSRRAQKVPARTPPSQDSIDKLAHALVDEDREAWTKVLAVAQADGATLQTIYEDYLAAAARRLGEWWVKDEMTFGEVTIGVGRIYAIMRSLRLSMPPQRPGAKFAVFASVPGETHTLGVTMAADIFRQNGWLIDLKTGLSHDELIEQLEQVDCTLVGISASSRRFTMALVRAIVALRITLPNALILVSGPIADLEPDIIGITGADFATADLNAAMDELNRAWTSRFGG